MEAVVADSVSAPAVVAALTPSGCWMGCFSLTFTLMVVGRLWTVTVVVGGSVPAPAAVAVLTSFTLVAVGSLRRPRCPVWILLICWFINTRLLNLDLHNTTTVA